MYLHVFLRPQYKQGDPGEVPRTYTGSSRLTLNLLQFDLRLKTVVFDTSPSWTGDRIFSRGFFSVPLCPLGSNLVDDASRVPSGTIAIDFSSRRRSPCRSVLSLEQEKDKEGGVDLCTSSISNPVPCRFHLVLWTGVERILFSFASGSKRIGGARKIRGSDCVFLPSFSNLVYTQT